MMRRSASGTVPRYSGLVVAHTRKVWNLWLIAFRDSGVALREDVKQRRARPVPAILVAL
jgi:hypothetical protein